MEFHDFELVGAFEIRPRKIADDRGYFCESFRLNEFHERVPGAAFVQENQSFSVEPGTIRGIHFQTLPKAQGKLVRCIAGKLFDVIVDLRADSPTYGRWTSAILTAEAVNQLWVPVGFGHGFCTLEPNCVISYRVTDYYSREHDNGVAWDDPELDIEWPAIADPGTLSPKDRHQPRFGQLPVHFTMEDGRCA
jgi:dTDP-4-dehydrorhamnose 3,5-epimerase